MDIVRQRLHIGEAFVAQQRAEPPAALSLPAVIDIDEVPAVGGESAFNQSVGDGRIRASLTPSEKQYQLFHPIGGVS